MEVSSHLGEGFFLTSKIFKGDRIVHIRWYGENGGHVYPTKFGVCMKPDRFAAFVEHLDNINAAYEYVISSVGEWRTVHIGGALYASVRENYQFIDLRNFFRARDGKVLPSKNGVAIPISVWSVLKKVAVDLKESIPELKTAQSCGPHQNQLEFVDCSECNPFYDVMKPATLPPVYVSFLKPDPPAKKKRKSTDSDDCSK
jgi:hypothetical protein